MKFKKKKKKNRSYDELENKRNWAWLNNKPCFDYNMGSERQSRLLEDFEKVKNQCNSLGLILPNSFIDFFNTPTYWQKFLSSNDGFFYLDKSVIFCPYINGYLIPFIADSQHCHYYYLHLQANQKDYEIVWTEDIYLMALLATPEELETDFAEGEFDETDIYLIDNDFERFMFDCYYDYYDFFKGARQKLIDYSYAYTNLEQRKNEQNDLENQSKLLLGIDEKIPLFKTFN